MKVIHISYSNFIGGASIAAYRLHESLKKKLSTRMWVNNASYGDLSVGINDSKLHRIFAKSAPYISGIMTKLLNSKNFTHLSPSLFGTGWVKQINQSDADIIHLHWLQREMFSISDIAKINKPLVWTLHDMWGFCGAEHYAKNLYWKDGYEKENLTNKENTFDINIWTWKRKFKYWKKKINIITPSKWLGSCVKKSKLMNNWPVTVLPTPIDTELWKPLDRIKSRTKLKLSQDTKFILFSAAGGVKDPRKGFNLFLEAMKILKKSNDFNNLELLILGQKEPINNSEINFPIHYLGHISETLILRLVYNAADMMIIPSLQDNLPNTGVEAHSCGVPVVAFNVGGLPDIVSHKESGYLANSYDINDLANGIDWVLRNNDSNKLSLNARESAIKKFSESILNEKYTKLYNEIIKDYN